MLVHLAEEVGTPCPLAPGSFMRVPQHVVAAGAHLSRQKVNEVLQTFRAARLVHLEHGFLCVVDRETLKAIAGAADVPPPAARPTVCKFRHRELALDCVE